MLQLNKVLYSLKQLAWIWYTILKQALVQKLGFKVLETKSCIFINSTTGVILSVFVNDIAIISTSISAIFDFI